MTVPSSTYRVQFGPAFTLADGAGIVDYLAALGVGALYSSPLLASGPGSAHGYDVVDPSRVCPDRGGEPGRQRLVRALKRARLGFVVDVVCNHVGVAQPAANPWWWDVLRHGQESAYARYFDIDWSAGPLLIPVLADESAHTEIKVDEGSLWYHEHRFPLAPHTVAGTPEQVHAQQHYRLVAWRRGIDELNHRRFFNIDTLAGVRTEDPEVFAAMHAEVLRWVDAGEVTGLRIDHPDGLADPGGYLRRLRAAAPHAWIVIEKVVATGEPIPASWPVDGLTGYEALREICGVFVDPGGRESFTRGEDDPAAIIEECRRLIADTMLVAECRRVASLVAFLVPDKAYDDCLGAAVELLVAFPVYRSYLPEHRWALDAAAQRALASAPPQLAGIVTAMRDEMAARPTGELAIRFQQATGAMMAKAVEDTAFYRHHRLVSLNEVGGELSRFDVTPAEFHGANAARESGWPHTMTTLSTHDTKRSEDVRARLAVLSEIPQSYQESVSDWSRRCPVGDPALEPLAWQTLIGAWPIGHDRLHAFLLKAIRETRAHTNWIDPDREYESRIGDWARRVLDDESLTADIAAFVARIEQPGWSNSLGQKLLQLAGPGVPDVYQGTELWDWSLVDPDNRRPVDFAARRALLGRLDDGWLPEVDAEGAAKLLVTSRVLRLRRSRPWLWSGYRPVFAEGPAASHLVGFSRGAGELVAVATRLPVGLDRRGGWADTVLPMPGGWPNWTDAFTGASFDNANPLVGELLHRYPVALLTRTLE